MGPGVRREDGRVFGALCENFWIQISNSHAAAFSRHRASLVFIFLSPF
jgi:hypothetical protein